MRYVAFLRGVNVGGRIMRMADARAAMIVTGFADATTYLQTGNILFDGGDQSLLDIQIKVNEAITGLDPAVRVAIRSASEMRRIVATDPFDRSDEATDSHRYVTFLVSPASLELPMQSPKGDVVVALKTDGEIYSVSKLIGTGYGYPNVFVEAKLKIAATTRNWNVVCKIEQLLVDFESSEH